MRDNKDIEKYLKALGKSSNQVQRRLQRRGIKGVPENPRLCPIARYLNQSTDDVDESFFVTGTQVLVKRQGKSSWVDLPPSVITFIRKFDKLEYLELLYDPDEPRTYQRSKSA